MADPAAAAGTAAVSPRPQPLSALSASLPSLRGGGQPDRLGFPLRVPFSAGAQAPPSGRKEYDNEKKGAKQKRKSICHTKQPIIEL